MLDRCYMRAQIIEFLKDKKLNKNSYFKKWYENYGAPEIYDYIQQYYSDTALDNLPIGQKLYHIVNNIDIIPEVKFISFSRGYVKGRVGRSGKSVDGFISAFENLKIDETQQILSIDNTISRTQHYIDRSAFTSFLKDNQLLRSIYAHTSESYNIKYRIASIYNNDTVLCRCGALRKFRNNNTFRLYKTCSKKTCISKVLSCSTQVRDLSYLQAPEIKFKRIQSRKGYRHTHATRNKISVSNKRTWTEEKKKKLTERNKINGVYERQSDTIRSKILNGSFTPNTLNRYTKQLIKSNITGINNYRSSWECQFHEANPSLQYEITRIQYNFEGKRRIYIVDFTDNVNRILYEVKPAAFLESPINIAKFQAARDWCSRNNYTFKIVNEDNICKITTQI